jgi:hypothetical protein
VKRVRLLSQTLPDFLSLTKPFSRSPALSDLARLEKAFHAALDAPDAGIITHALLHPSVQRLQLRSNAASIWAALTAGELPPPPERLDGCQELLVWRQGTTARFRILGREEAAALDGASRGEAVAIDQSSEGFLRGWLEAEVMSAMRDLNDVGEK